MKKLVVEIEGMSCGHCLNAVNRSLRGLTGVQVDSVRIGRAEVTYDERSSDPSNIAAAVKAAGYSVLAFREA